jgi:hypothetical protein
MISKEWIDKIKKLLNTPQRILDDFELRKSNYGRDFGWFVEFENQVLGELIEPIFADMFWMRYTVIIYPNMENIIRNKEIWDECLTKFRNKKYNQYAENAFGNVIEENGKIYVSMRGLYLSEIKKGKK